MNLNMRNEGALMYLDLEEVEESKLYVTRKDFRKMVTYMRDAKKNTRLSRLGGEFDTRLHVHKTHTPQFYFCLMSSLRASIFIRDRTDQNRHIEGVYAWFTSHVYEVTLLNEFEQVYVDYSVLNVMEKFSANGYNVMHTTTLSRGSPLCRLVWMSKVIRRPNTADAFGWQITVKRKRHKKKKKKDNKKEQKDEKVAEGNFMDALCFEKPSPTNWRQYSVCFDLSSGGEISLWMKTTDPSGKNKGGPGQQLCLKRLRLFISRTTTNRRPPPHHPRLLKVKPAEPPQPPPPPP